MKNSFVMYTDYQEQIDLLDMEQRGMLLTAIMEYASSGTVPEIDGMVLMAFSFIRKQMDKDNEKYQKVVEARREAGKKGAEAKKANASFAKDNQAKESKAKQALANQADNDNVNDNDTPSLKDKELRGEEEKTSTIPTLEEVKEFCEALNLKIDPEEFYNYYNQSGWKSSGEQVRDWKALTLFWNRKITETKDKKQKPIPKRNTNEFTEKYIENINNQFTKL